MPGKEQVETMESHHYGINAVVGNIKVIEISPVAIMGKTWYCVGFEEEGVSRGDFMHLAFVLHDETSSNSPDLLATINDLFLEDRRIPVRIHSECILGDAFYSELCDCGPQLKKSIQMIVGNGKGVVLYLRQEGRNIGMRAKLSCLSLQEGYLNGKKIDRKYSSDEANVALGFEIDQRSYAVAARFLKLIGAIDIVLISGNPKKISDLKHFGIRITKSVDIKRSFSQHSNRVLREMGEKLSRNYKYRSLPFFRDDLNPR